MTERVYIGTGGRSGGKFVFDSTLTTTAYRRDLIRLEDSMSIIRLEDGIEIVRLENG